MEVSGVPPVKYQFQEVGLLVDWSVKSIQAVSQILVLEDANDAVGLHEFTVM